MKKYYVTAAIIFSFVVANAQNNQSKISADSISVFSKVEFYTYNGPYGEKQNIKEPAIKFVLTIKNNGLKPIPDLGATKRSENVNLLINDTINNPVSLYNGIEVQGEHMLRKNESDTYTWWVFEKGGYGNVFTIQWQYMDLFSEKMKVNVLNKTISIVE